MRCQPLPSARSSAHEHGQHHEHRAAGAAVRLRRQARQVWAFGNTREYVRELIRRDQRAQAIARLPAMVEVGLVNMPARSDTAEANWTAWTER